MEKWSKLSAGLCVRKCEAMKEKGFVCLPYVEGLSENIRRVLRTVGIRVACKPMSWKGTMMEGVKDKLGWMKERDQA